MTQEKLKQIIERENESLEREAVGNATDIIRSISCKTAQIAQLQRDIVELQADLKKIEITQIDPLKILGA